MSNRFVLGRRQALRVGLGAALGVIVSPLARAGIVPPDRRILSFENLHTGERLTAPYWTEGRYDSAACHQIDWLLRDFRSGDSIPISRELFDLLHALRVHLDSKAPFQVISGYRSPKTNAHLASASSGVASNSLHMKGQAIDVRLPDCSLAHLRQAAMSLKAGGVGYYPKSNFVHIDVGRVRYW